MINILSRWWSLRQKKFKKGEAGGTKTYMFFALLFQTLLWFIKLTLQPTTSNKDLSEKGCSNSPTTNFTLRMRSTASSILDMDILPDSTRNTKSSKNFSYLWGTIICTTVSRQIKIKVAECTVYFFQSSPCRFQH